MGDNRAKCGRVWACVEWAAKSRPANVSTGRTRAACRHTNFETTKLACAYHYKVGYKRKMKPRQGAQRQRSKTRNTNKSTKSGPLGREGHQSMHTFWYWAKPEKGCQ